jgi:tetratricopeptide (TPR) repeat protein
VGVDIATYGRWERGCHLPRVDHTPRLLGALGVSASDLGLDEETLRARPPVSLGPAPASTAVREDDDVERRQLLRRALAYGAAITMAPIDWDHLGAAIAHPRMVSTRLIHEMHGVTREYMRLCQTTSPTALLPSVENHLAALNRLQAGATGDATWGAQAATSQAAMMAGWLFMEAGDRPNARSRLAFAEELAASAQADALRAQIITVSSYLDTGVTQRRASRRALIALDEAVATAPRDSDVVRSYIHARRAEERAAADDASGAFADLESAQRALHSGGVDPDALYAYRADELWIEAYRASVHRLLGRPADAATAASCALPTLHTRARPAVLSDQAGALADNGQLDAACTTLIQAVELMTASGHLTYRDRIRGIRAELEPHATAPAVRQLDEVLAATA